MLEKLLIYEQFKDLQFNCPKLSLCLDDNGSCFVRGRLYFSAEFSNERIDDEYSIEVFVPQGYPKEVPTVKEVSNRIPKDFHKYPDDTLCLGSPLAVLMKFNENPTLVGFFDNCLIPYLYSYSYKSKYGRLPFGELSHGWLGIFEHYKELFGTNKIKTLLEFFEISIKGKYRGHLSCPCGSGKRLRKCHGEVLRKISDLQLIPLIEKDHVILKKVDEYIQQKAWAECGRLRS